MPEINTHPSNLSEASSFKPIRTVRPPRIRSLFDQTQPREVYLLLERNLQETTKTANSSAQVWQGSRHHFAALWVCLALGLNLAQLWGAMEPPFFFRWVCVFFRRPCMSLASFRLPFQPLNSKKTDPDIEKIFHQPEIRWLGGPLPTHHLG